MIERILSAGAAILCVAAGVYLLSKNSIPVTVGAKTGQSWFEIIAHGMGIYFIGKGLFVLANLSQQRAQVRSLRQLVEIGARDRGDTAE
jgi:hypothetical protein